MTVLMILGAAAALAVAAVVAEAARATPPDRDRPQLPDRLSVVPVPRSPQLSAGAAAPSPHRPSTSAITAVGR